MHSKAAQKFPAVLPVLQVHCDLEPLACRSLKFVSSERAAALHSWALGKALLSRCLLPTSPPACRYNVMRMTVNWHKGFHSCCASFVAPTANLLRLPKLFFKDVSVLTLHLCTGGRYSAWENINPFFPRADARHCACA